MATLISNKIDKPMVMRRKEAKGYGTKQLIEGVYKEGDRCLIVEDVISTGSSILETIAVSKEVILIGTHLVLLIVFLNCWLYF